MRMKRPGTEGMHSVSLHGRLGRSAWVRWQSSGRKLLRWWVIMVLMDRYCLPEECFSNRWLPGLARSAAIFPGFPSAMVSWSSLMESSRQPMIRSAAGSTCSSLVLWAAGGRNSTKLWWVEWGCFWPLMCKIGPGCIRFWKSMAFFFFFFFFLEVMAIKHSYAEYLTHGRWPPRSCSTAIYTWI